ncbi:MAG: SRPBCC family protein [Chloroflexi bacterium]|nr:SRPBCC family protein [Chloroflexota bacterium]
MAKRIQLKTHRVRIKAPRELIFQKMSSFGRGHLKGDTNESSEVLSRDGDKLVVKFRTKAGPISYDTVEEITLESPRRITFKHLSGPLHYAWEEFVLEDVSEFETELVHDGEFIWNRIPFIGWFGGMIYTKPTFERLMIQHMGQIKETCEARAARSRVFPRPPAETDSS